MKSIFASYLPLSLAAASALRSLHYDGLDGSISRRSQELHVSLDAEAYMTDIVNNVTLLFHDSHTRHLEARSAWGSPSKVVGRDLSDIVERAPVATATTVTIPNDDPPPGTVWDESFQDLVNKDLSQQRAAVKTAWNEAMRLAGLSQSGLDALNKAVAAQNFNPNDQDGPKNFIAHNSPPMAQMFGSLPNLIQPVHDVFASMVNVVPNANSGNRNGNVLRLAYGDNMKKADGRTKVCGAVTSDSNEFYAFTFPNQPAGAAPNDLQKKYILDDSMIVFCPIYFGINLPSGVTAPPDDAAALAGHSLLDGLRTKGQTVVHEWAHLTWIQSANTNPDSDEIYGFQQAAQLFNDQGAAAAQNNADNYAVFSSYHAYNQEPWAPTDPRPAFGCHDVWPQNGGNPFNPAKPVKDTFP